MSVEIIQWAKNALISVIFSLYISFYFKKSYLIDQKSVKKHSISIQSFAVRWNVSLSLSLSPLSLYLSYVYFCLRMCMNLLVKEIFRFAAIYTILDKNL